MPISINNENRDRLTEALIDHIVDGMDMDTVIQFAKDQLMGYYEKRSDEELETEMTNFAPHLLEE